MPVSFVGSYREESPRSPNRATAWPVVLRYVRGDGERRLGVGLLIDLRGRRRVEPPTGDRHVLNRQVLAGGRPSPAEHMPPALLLVPHLGPCLGLLQPLLRDVIVERFGGVGERREHPLLPDPPALL